jgi:hypothetical protein
MPKGKFADVDLSGGKIEYCPDLRTQKAKAKGSKWINVQKEDLESFRDVVDKEYGLAFTGIACSGAYPMLTAKTPYNQLKAVMGRVFRRPKFTAEPGIFSILHKFKHLLLGEFIADKLTVEDWLNGMPRRRQRPLRQAYELLIRKGWSDSYTWFNAFLKIEALPGFAKGKVDLRRIEAVVDRLIQGPHDVTHVIAGPYLKPLMYKLKQVWNKDFPIFYGSTGPEALHKWLNETLLDGGASYFWCDYSMFDNTHCAQSWDFMESLYRAGPANSDPLFWKVMDAWRAPKGRIGPFRYQARVMNSSGRDDTALSNAVLNGFVAYLSAVSAFLKKDLYLLTESDLFSCFNKIKISICGDDSIGRLPFLPADRLEEFRQQMAHNIARFGFDAKLCASQKLYDAVYLGQRPYPTRKGWFWGKTIGRATYKMGFVVRSTPTEDVFAKMLGIADMHVLCSKHVPILSDLAEQIVKCSKGQKRTPVRLDPEKPWEWTYQSGVPYDDLTLQAVAEVYCSSSNPARPIEPNDVEACLVEIQELIKKIRAIEFLPVVLDDHFWRRLILVDEQ